MNTAFQQWEDDCQENPHATLPVAKLNAEQIAACGFDGHVPIKTRNFTMNTETPRTDASAFTVSDTVFHPGEPIQVVAVSCARQLERDLAALRAELAKLTKIGPVSNASKADVYQWLREAQAERDQLRAENAALREAGNEMRRIIDIPADTPTEQWATDAEIDKAIAVWDAALKGGQP